MSLSQAGDEKPVKWYTFHSEKMGRDYYYEPNSKVVTWIRPDDLHTHPSVPQTPQANQAAAVERRVSFHESVHENDTAQQRDRGMNVSTNATESASIASSRTRTPVLLLLVCVCILVMTVSYMEWLPRGPVGSALFGHTSESSKWSDAAEDARSQQQRKNDIEMESPVRDSNNEAKRGRHETMTTQQRSRQTHHGHQQDSSEQSSRAEHHSKPSIKQDERESYREASPESSSLKDARLERRNEMHSIDSASEDAGPSRDKHCMVPFAHVFSKECREVLAERPVYDMDALLDSLI